MGKLHDECGVFGIFSNEVCDVASSVYYGLFALQHRGQESCGIVVNDDGLFSHYVDAGIVNDVFNQRIMERLGEGSIAVGHVRYGTCGSNGRENAQPMVVSHVKGPMAIAHNGNLTNHKELREELEMEGAIFQTSSDTGVIAYLITKERLKSKSIEEAVSKAMARLEGAYSLVIMSASKLIAVRDKHGFRPLCYGVTPDGRYVIASESCALDSVGAKLVRDVEPGEVIVISKDGVKSYKEHCQKVKQSFCVFELIYFSRPDSVIGGYSVHSARIKAGEFLAKEHPVEADVVIGVPDSGIDAAIGYAKQSGIPYEIGFIKNKYIGRTFISPGQKSREDLVKIKLNVVGDTVKDKRVVLIDDSIVRGTTCVKIIKLLKDAGAKEIHMRVSAPAFKHACYYGTDIPSSEGLIANTHKLEEIAGVIGVDSLGYLSTQNVRRLIGDNNCDSFCSACFDGNYPTAVPTGDLRNRFEKRISDKE